MGTFDDFMKPDMRVGTITEADVFAKARKLGYRLKVDFGAEIGEKKSPHRLPTATRRKS